MAVKFVFYPPQQEATRRWARRLADSLPEIAVSVPETDEEALREIRDADAAFGTLPGKALALASRLRWLQAPAAGPPAGYYYPELVRHPATVTNLRGIFNDHIATHIMAYVLAFARGFHYYGPEMLRGQWKPREVDSGVVHLPEATVVIIGVGGIGAETARLCAAFGATVIGIDARRTDRPEGVKELSRPGELDRALPSGDFVILTVPHTPQTEGLFDARRFQLMKRGSFFINIGRGMTTNLHDLDSALRSGHLGGAGLDVFEVEPLPAGHPLWTAPNVILTPHTAGYGPYLDDRTCELIVDNARRFSAGQPLRNVVDKANWF